MDTFFLCLFSYLALNSILTAVPKYQEQRHLKQLAEEVRNKVHLTQAEVGNVIRDLHRIHLN